MPVKDKKSISYTMLLLSLLLMLWQLVISEIARSTPKPVEGFQEREQECGCKTKTKICARLAPPCQTLAVLLFLFS